MKQIKKINASLYIKRRLSFAQIIRKKTGSGILILYTSSKEFSDHSNNFQQNNSDFYYLTGLNELNSCLIILITKDKHYSYVFLPERDEHIEIWSDKYLDCDIDPEVLGMDAVYSIHKLFQYIKETLCDQEHLYTNIYQMLGYEKENWINIILRNTKNKIILPNSIHNAIAIIHEMRLIKDKDEIDLMRRSSEISSIAHIETMRACQPGLFEYQLEAKLSYVFKYMGAQDVAYPSIVATGGNACILHHIPNNTLLQDGDLCLIDAGCKLDGYSSDISRTFPINGTFSSIQKSLYEIVLDAQEKAIQKAHIGCTLFELDMIVIKILTTGLLDLGILSKDKLGSVDNAIEKKAYKKYYMHRTSHWIGLDVHDVGNYKENQFYRQLKPGMVITVEPGIYIKSGSDCPKEFWDIGIRIEDDIHITNFHPEILTRKVPVKIPEIEDIMKS